MSFSTNWDLMDLKAVDWASLNFFTGSLELSVSVILETGRDTDVSIPLSIRLSNIPGEECESDKSNDLLTCKISVLSE